MFCIVTVVRVMFCIVTVVRVMFCIVTVVRVMFCIVTVVRVHVLYCDSGTQESSWTSTGVMHHYVHARCRFRLDIEELETTVSPEFSNFLSGKNSRGCEFIGFVDFLHRIY